MGAEKGGNGCDDKLTDRFRRVWDGMKAIVGGDHHPHQEVVMSRRGDECSDANTSDANTDNTNVAEKPLPGHANLTARLRQAALMERHHR